MAWPTMSDYQETIQNPTTCFFDHELKNGTPLLNNLGLPKPIAGGFACVYQMICGSHTYAVRCFLTKQLDLEKRYKIISDYLRQINLPYMVNFEFIAQGIRVNGQWFPILKMEWITGEPLNIYLEKNLHKPQKLEALASNFTTLIEDLRKYSIAHGDLQHENILVANEQLKLIDYDGLFVPGLEAIPSHEYGHRNYQHPSRDERDFGPKLDNFSTWVIYTSILALSEDPTLWDQFEAGDGSLIFRKEDFLAPNQSLAFKLFEQSSSTLLQSLAGQLRTILNYNNLSEIPIVKLGSFAASTNSQNTSPSSLPPWLRDYVVLPTTISAKNSATQSEEFNVPPKLTSLIIDRLLTGVWFLGVISIYIFEVLSLIDLPISFDIFIGLSTVGLVFMKRYKYLNRYLNNELQKYILNDSSVHGIGPQLIIALNKAGITTAADLLNIHIIHNDWDSLKSVALIEVAGKGKLHIDGIGPVKARALLDWKNLLESNLKPPLLLPSSQLNALRAKYKQQRDLIQKEIKQLRLGLTKWLEN